MQSRGKVLMAASSRSNRRKVQSQSWQSRRTRCSCRNVLWRSERPGGGMEGTAVSFSNGKTRAGQAWGSGRDAVWGERVRQARSGMWVGCPTKAPFTATGRPCPGGAVLGTGRRPARGRSAVTHPRRLNTDRWPRPRIPCGRPQLAVPSVVPETVPACWVPVRYQGGLASWLQTGEQGPASSVVSKAHS